MKNDGHFMTRKEQQRVEFEEHFFATWPGTLDAMSYDEMKYFNETKLEGINAGYPDTMLWLKYEVLRRMAIYESEGDKSI